MKKKLIIPTGWTFLLFIHHPAKRNKGRSSQYVHGGTDTLAVAWAKLQRVGVNDC